jgi:hypothetical protein
VPLVREEKKRITSIPPRGHDEMQTDKLTALLPALQKQPSLLCRPPLQLLRRILSSRLLICDSDNLIAKLYSMFINRSMYAMDVPHQLQ